MKMNRHYTIAVPYLPARQPERELWRHVLTGHLYGALPNGVEVVYCDSPESNKKAVHELARLFRREFHYDFVQYHASSSDPDARALLWVDECHGSRTAIGACCFRLRDGDERETHWGLQWVWFHPYERQKGHLSRAWLAMRKRFGTFAVEEPLSKAMSVFLERHGGDPYRVTRAEERTLGLDRGGLPQVKKIDGRHELVVMDRSTIAPAHIALPAPAPMVARTPRPPGRATVLARKPRRQSMAEPICAVLFSGKRLTAKSPFGRTGVGTVCGTNIVGDAIDFCSLTDDPTRVTCPKCKSILDDGGFSLNDGSGMCCDCERYPSEKHLPTCRFVTLYGMPSQ